MQELLMQKLLHYITENHPDLLLQLETEGSLTNYLLDKVSSVAFILNRSDQPDYLKEEACMDAMTKSLRPSKFNYICRVLEEEFSATYGQLQRSGTLRYEAVNLVMYCEPLFEAVHFNEANEENKLLYYAIAGAILEYFEREESENEIVSNGVQQPTEAEG